MILKSVIFSAVILVGALGLALPAASNNLSVVPDLEQAGWKVLIFPGKAATQFVGRKPVVNGQWPIVAALAAEVRRRHGFIDPPAPR